MKLVKTKTKDSGPDGRGAGVRVHRIPVHRDSDSDSGEGSTCAMAAPVDSYFEKFIKKDQRLGALTCSFRGRPLVGEEMSFPKGYTGGVVSKSSSAVRLLGTFSTMNVWNLDSAPNDNDSIRQAMQWTKIAEALHENTTET